MSTKFMVTGGAGFLGSHLCDRLIKDGHEVLCIDNLSTGNIDNIRHLDNNQHFEFVQHDVTSPWDRTERLDGIYHLACPASPIRYQSAPVYTTQTAVLGTLNMLQIAQQQNIPFLHTSTSEVYGDPEVHPQPETYTGNVNPIGTRACYDEGKRCAESLCFDYHRMYGLAIKVVRIFNTYGPRMHAEDGRVVSTFIRQALAEQPITLFGNGLQTRSFCYVDDLIEGLIRMMDSPGSVTGPINLGSPHEINMVELATIVRELTRSSSVISYSPLPEDDPIQRCPDIHRAQTYLHWSPKVPLKAGLLKTMRYFQLPHQGVADEVPLSADPLTLRKSFDTAT